ncbi:ATP-binding protein, partial [Streptomyces sp. TRM76130]|nr:ATP-binding protein [Streptomyces sp. TRM76130]
MTAGPAARARRRRAAGAVAAGATGIARPAPAPAPRTGAECGTSQVGGASVPGGRATRPVASPESATPRRRGRPATLQGPGGAPG